MKLFSDLTKQERDSFKFQFARDVTNKLSRKEVIALFSLVAMQANNDLNKVEEMAEAYCQAHVNTSKVMIEHINQLGINWKDKIEELCEDFCCKMTVEQCLDLLFEYINAACAEKVRAR